MVEVTVRPLTKQLADGVLRLCLNDPHEYGSEPPVVSMARANFYKNPIHYAICVEGIPVGYALITRYRTGFKLKNFTVDAKYQGCGFASQGLRQLLSMLHADVYLAVDPSNAVAVHLYEKNGFVDYPRSKNGWRYMIRQS